MWQHICPNYAAGIMRLSEIVAAKAASLLSRRAAAECSPGRQPGVCVVLRMSPGGATDPRDIRRASGARDTFGCKSTGLRPWLHSSAATRLCSDALRASFGLYLGQQ